MHTQGRKKKKRLNFSNSINVINNSLSNIVIFFLSKNRTIKLSIISVKFKLLRECYISQKVLISISIIMIVQHSTTSYYEWCLFPFHSYRPSIEYRPLLFHFANCGFIDVPSSPNCFVILIYSGLLLLIPGGINRSN